MTKPVIPGKSVTVARRDCHPEKCAFSEQTPELIQRLYAARQVYSEQDLGRELAELPAPDSLKGLAQAIDLLQQALLEKQRIMIVGDFDADGATSTALTTLALTAMGAESVEFLVPNRFEYGYGLTPEIVELAKTRDPDLLITVDNGISSIEGVEAAHQAGIKVLVTDHHLPGATLPDADAMVNPNQPGCEFPGKHLAGVGVAFYVLTALRSRLRQGNWFENNNIAEPNMAQWLDLVALGTVADVVPLDRINRILVHQGIRRIRAGAARPGILALLDVANRDNQRLVSSDLGFAVGPRLNAAGRLDDMSHGILCLLENDPVKAREMAVELDQLNVDRRAIETGMQQEALAIVEKLNFTENSLPWGLCLHDEGWHQGVVGLLASRIKDRFHRPVIAFAPGEQGQLKGSARSINGLHIRDALDVVASRNPGLVTRFGGHAMAAGLSLQPEHFERFATAFDQVVKEILGPDGLEQTIMTDGNLAQGELNLDNAELIRQGGPWGQHFPEPLFHGRFRIAEQRTVGENHWKLTLVGAGESSASGVDAIAFRVDEDIRAGGAREVEVLYKLDVNEWRGTKTTQLLIERILFCS